MCDRSSDPESAFRAPHCALKRSTIAIVSVGALILFALPASAEAHGGGPESIVSFSGLVNWLHLVSTVAWLGGIVFLRIVLGPATRILPPAQRRQLIAATLQRYVHLAWWAIAALFFTGVLTTWAHVPSPQSFTGTTYGLILIGKILLSLGMVACTLIITLAGRSPSPGSNGTTTATAWQRWSRIATRANLGLAVLMLVSIAALTEFERTPLNILMNLVYYGGITIWLGGLVFVQVILGPSLRAVEKSSRMRLAAAVLTRYQRLSWPVALATIAASVYLAARGLDDPADLWSSGFGIASSLHVFSLAMVVVVMAATRFTPRDLLRQRSGDAMASSIPTLLFSALALLFFAFEGALYAPRSAELAAEIPLAVNAGAGPALNLLEPLGYVIAVFVAAAVIWHFAVVEGRAERAERAERSEQEAD